MSWFLFCWIEIRLPLRREARRKMFVCPLSLYGTYYYQTTTRWGLFYGRRLGYCVALLAKAPLDPKESKLSFSNCWGFVLSWECSDPTETPLQRIKKTGEKFTLLPFLLTVVSWELNKCERPAACFFDAHTYTLRLPSASWKIQS